MKTSSLSKLPDYEFVGVGLDRLISEGSPTFEKVSVAGNNRDLKNANSLFKRRFCCHSVLGS